ncbi:MAG: DUF4258 domain-containing protein [Chloroflexi bacterium]|nr:DUF4258 domain-containing protein [Chloroflexota bacterium]
MAQRDVREARVVEALAGPEQTLEGLRNRKLARRSFGHRILEVVYTKEVGVVIVITAYWLPGERL